MTRNPLGRALFDDPAMIREARPASPPLVVEQPYIGRDREHNAAAAKIGVSSREYRDQLEAGNAWCWFGRHFVPDVTLGAERLCPADKRAKGVKDRASKKARTRDAGNV